MKRGYLTPPIIIILAIITFFVAATIAVNSYFKKTAQNQPSSQSANQSSSFPSPSPDETANWKIYTNTKYRFTIKYPNDKEVDINEQNVFENVCDQMNPIVGIQIYPANRVKDDKDIDFAGDLWISISFTANSNQLIPVEYMAKNCAELFSKAVKENVKIGENEALKLEYNQVQGEQEAAIISHKKELFYIHAYSYSKE